MSGSEQTVDALCDGGSFHIVLGIAFHPCPMMSLEGEHEAAVMSHHEPTAVAPTPVAPTPVAPGPVAPEPVTPEPVTGPVALEPVTGPVTLAPVTPGPVTGLGPGPNRPGRLCTRQ